MRIIIYLLLLASLMGSTLSQGEGRGGMSVVMQMSHHRVTAPGPEALIVLSFGQSNEGQSAMDWVYTHPTVGVYPEFLLPAGYDDTDARIQIAVDFARPVRAAVIQPHNQSPRWEAIDGSWWTSYGFAAYGWEQRFLRLLQQETGDTIYFLRICKGGVPIEAFLPGGELYSNIGPLVTFAINDLIAKGKNPKIIFANWGQGEANESDLPAVYAGKLASFVNYARNIYPPYTTNMPFAFRKLTSEQNIITGQANINTGFDQTAIALPHCFTYNPSTFTPGPTLYDEPGYSPGFRIHYTGPFQIQMGDSLYRWYRDGLIQ